MHSGTQCRQIYILRYLWQNTDDEHQATRNDIIQYLSSIGIQANSKTVGSDIDDLSEMGFDIVCVKSTQSRYFLASRIFELPEIKLLIDAIQAAQFIPECKAEALVKKMGALTSKEQIKRLKSNLVVSKIKGDNTQFIYTVDLLNTAINTHKQVKFQYAEYDRDGKRALKYDGYTYTYSPIAIVWNMDSYYVAGFSKKHDAIIKFRIDKIVKPQITDEDAIPVPDDLDLSKAFQKMFLMYGDKEEAVTLRCEYCAMNKIIDRFGEDIAITPIDDEHFEVTQTVMTGSTFYSWVFNYRGQIRITAPESTKQEFRKMLHCFDEPEISSDDLPF